MSTLPTPVRTIKDNIALARRFLDNEHDPIMANYVLRDLQETKDAGLSDIAWAIDRGMACHNDVVYLIEQLEEHLANKEPEE